LQEKFALIMKELKFREEIGKGQAAINEMIIQGVIEGNKELQKLIDDLDLDIKLNVEIDTDATVKAIADYEAMLAVVRRSTGAQRDEINKNIAQLYQWRREGRITADVLEEELERLRRKLEDLNTWAEKNPFWASLGIENQEQLNLIKDYANEIMGVINDLIDQQVQASQRLVNDLSQRVDEQQHVVNREFEMRKEGLANNYEVEQENLRNMQAARDEAIRERERYIKIQRTLSTIESGIALISAAANIIKGFSEIPIVGWILGIAAVGAMIASFIAAKGSVSDATKLEEGGWLKGKRHKDGGIPLIGGKYEGEDGEFLVNRNSAKKYSPLIEAINQDDKNAMRLYFDRKFINQVPQIIVKENDYSNGFDRIVKELRRGKTEIIYGDGFYMEKSKGYTKRVNL